MLRSLRKASQSFILATLVVVAGCRTYGGEYSGTEANNDQLRLVAERLAGSAERAADSHRRLGSVQGVDPALMAEYGDIVDEHRAAAVELAAFLDSSTSLGYRSASRRLGAAISATRGFENRYQAVLRAIVGDTSRAEPDRESRYGMVPAYYHVEETSLTIDDVTGRIGSGG